MKPVEIIFDRLQMLNPTTQSISSLGSYVSQSSQMVVDAIRTEVIKNVPAESLAHKIITSADRFSAKQLWVIAFELVKNAEYTESVVSEYEYRVAKVAQKNEESKNKLAANKEASSSVLDFVKSNGRLLKDYYAFVKGTKKYAKEFYSKKFTMESANDFLNK